MDFQRAVVLLTVRILKPVIVEGSLKSIEAGGYRAYMHSGAHATGTHVLVSPAVASQPQE